MRTASDRAVIAMLAFVVGLLIFGIVVSVIGPSWWHDCYMNCV